MSLATRLVSQKGTAKPEISPESLLRIESVPGPYNRPTLTQKANRTPRRYKPRRLTEETYWAQPRKNAGESHDLARVLIDEYRGRPGIEIDPRKSSLVVKYDIHDSGQLVSLFFIDTRARLGVWPDVIARQIARAGLDSTLADGYGKEAREIMHMPKYRKDYYCPIQSVDIKRFTHAVDGFLRVLKSAALEASWAYPGEARDKKEKGGTFMSKFTLVKKADLPKIARRRPSKYQHIVDELFRLKEDEALLVNFDEGENVSALRHAAKTADLKIRTRKNPDADNSWYVFVAAEALVPRRPPKAAWDEDRFFAVASEQAPPAAIPLITQLYEFVTAEAEAWKWGTGAKYGNILWRARVGGKPFSVFNVSTLGALGFGFGSYPEAVTDNLREELRQRLNQIGGLTIERHKARPGRFPAYPLLDVFVEEEDLELFKDTIRWFASAIGVSESALPHPEIGDLFDFDEYMTRERSQRFAELWGPTRHRLRERGWKRVYGSQIAELYVKDGPAQNLEWAWLDPIWKRGSLRIGLTFGEDVDLSKMASLLEESKEILHPDTEVVIAKRRRKEGLIDVVDVLVPMTKLFEGLTDAESIAQRLSDYTLAVFDVVG